VQFHPTTGALAPASSGLHHVNDKCVLPCTVFWEAVFVCVYLTIPKLIPLLEILCTASLRYLPRSGVKGLILTILGPSDAGQRHPTYKVARSGTLTQFPLDQNWADLCVSAHACELYLVPIDSAHLYSNGYHGKYFRSATRVVCVTGKISAN